ncbi:MAG: Rpn family recombination-promoting nuclease/putative transposase [Bacilli bacterium]|nr:Rpn family recombination-promoting nuclease/putative transposase [Bacilli bacterium]
MLDNDRLFKKIFSNELYLKQLLLEFFNVKCDTIKYLNTELVKTNKYDKVGIVDLFLEINGEIVILELQNINRYNFEDRLLFYSSVAIHNHCLKEGDDYNKLKYVRVYAIINYSLFKNVKSKVRLKGDNKIFTEKLEYQIFDLTKVDKNNEKNRYYELVNLFNNKNLQNLELIVNSEINKRILEEIKLYNLDEEEYQKMEEIERLMMNETEHYDTAYEAGIENGISLGITQGINKGKNDRNIEIAKNLLNKNVGIDLIIDVTGLTYEQISFL